MSIENSINSWSNKRCTFGVSDRCVTRECTAWKEVEDEYDYEYKYSAEKPGLFSSWEIIDTETESYEVRVGGGEYADFYETKYRVIGYRLRSKRKKLVREGYGYCGRL